MPQKIRPRFLHPSKVGKAHKGKHESHIYSGLLPTHFGGHPKREWANLEATLILPEAEVEEVATSGLHLDRSFSECRHHFRRHLTFYGTSIPISVAFDAVVTVII
jgi:hypothetical protein